MPRRTARRLTLLALLGAAAALPAWAASSGASLASESISTSIGSASTSVRKSSDSSSSRDGAVAQGDYRVEEVAAVDERPGLVRLKLQALAPAGTDDGVLYLYLPPATLAQARVGAGALLTATPRDYGTAFARTDTREAFFLVLADDWFRELNANAVAL